MNLLETFQLTWKQKINFTTHFFYKILQRSNTLVISDNLAMSSNTYLKRQYQFEETFDFYLEKNQPYLSHSSFNISNIAKIQQTCYFGYFEHAWSSTIWCLLTNIKSTSSPMFFWRYCKVMCKLLLFITLVMPVYAHP